MELIFFGFDVQKAINFFNDFLSLVLIISAIFSPPKYGKTPYSVALFTAIQKAVAGYSTSGRLEINSVNRILRDTSAAGNRGGDFTLPIC